MGVTAASSSCEWGSPCTYRAHDILPVTSTSGPWTAQRSGFDHNRHVEHWANLSCGAFGSRYIKMSRVSLGSSPGSGDIGPVLVGVVGCSLFHSSSLRSLNISSRIFERRLV